MGTRACRHREGGSRRRAEHGRLGRVRSFKFYRVERARGRARGCFSQQEGGATHQGVPAVRGQVHQGAGSTEFVDGAGWAEGVRCLARGHWWGAGAPLQFGMSGAGCAGMARACPVPPEVECTVWFAVVWSGMV
eukprot:gene2407-biopygen4993